ncbi:MAG: TA system VapC family ribonuclease toxin [Fimbriimonadaceae bacterium]
MILPDVNIYLAALREDQKWHKQTKDWLQIQLALEGPVAVWDVTLASVVRIATNAKTYKPATPIATVVQFCDTVRSSARAIAVGPSGSFWPIFCGLVQQGKVTGPDVPDAMIAALALDQGCTLVSFDRGFRRFPGLNWKRATALLKLRA